jgi:hypothetical protein
VNRKRLPQTDNFQGIRDNHALHFVIRFRDTFEQLQALQSSNTARKLVRKHSSDHSPEHTGRGTEVERSVLSGVSQVLFVHEELPIDLVTSIWI